MQELLGGKLGMSEVFYLLQHSLYGCLSPQCHFVYTEDEIKTGEFTSYLKNHEYGGEAPTLYPLEAKVWKLKDIINLESIYGWTPRYALESNGFECTGKIDVFKDIFRIKPKPYLSPEHDLEEKKDVIKRKLDEIGAFEREFLIFRTSREGLNVWDYIYVFDIGKYHTNKKEIREQIVLYCQKSQDEEKEEIKKRLAENEAKGIKPVDFETAKKRFEEYIKEKNPKNFLFDPSTNTGYEMESTEGRKRLYQDITKRGKKKS